MRRLAASSTIPVFYSFSPALVPRPADWPAWVHAEGYWFPQPDADWRPPADLVQFLESGPTPVFVGFGSMSSRDSAPKAKRKLEMVFEALDRAGQRGIVPITDGAVPDVEFPSSVFGVSRLPYEWLFPRVSMTVHHGGSGTTAESARAGVPMLVTPFMWDQPFWGRRVHAARLGPAPIPHGKLNAANLGDAIRSVIDDEPMRVRARAFGERVRAEDGVGRTVEVIEERLGSWSRT
jgi:UDP:flavonoid glycosyltransferase YjiC (YdhE family)